MSSSLAPTQRFSNRVDTYVKYRPSYPVAVIDFLQEVYQLPEHAVVADIGSGTGIFTKLLLDKGFTVQAIEPNEAMRQAAEQSLATYKNFESLHGSAEQTGLPDHSVHLVIAAQAFHWFNRPVAQQEFYRILKPGSRMALLWNLIQQDTDFLTAYAALKLQFGTDIKEIHHADSEQIEPFFQPYKMAIADFSHEQLLDWQGLQGIILSSSFMPTPGHQHYDAMMQALKDLFTQHQSNGHVSLRYKARLYYQE